MDTSRLVPDAASTCNLRNGGSDPEYIPLARPFCLLFESYTHDRLWNRKDHDDTHRTHTHTLYHMNREWTLYLFYFTMTRCLIFLFLFM